MKTKTTYRPSPDETAAFAPSAASPSVPPSTAPPATAPPSPPSTSEQDHRAQSGKPPHGSDNAALYDVSALLTEVSAFYRGLLPPMPRPPQHYHATSVAELPAFLHHVCQDPSPVVVVRFLSGRGGSQPVSIFRRPLYAPSSVYGGEVQVAPPPRALDLVGQRLLPSQPFQSGPAESWLEPETLGPSASAAAVHSALPETFLEYMDGLDGRAQKSRDYDRMLVEEVIVAMATHRFSSAAYDQLGLYEVLAYDVDLEADGHELWRWTSGWLFPINVLRREPDLGHGGEGAPRHYCVYGGQA